MSDRDQLRDAISGAIADHAERCSCCPTIPNPTPLANWLLPVVDAHVQAERDRIAAAMPEAVADRITWSDGTEFIAAADAARIARRGGAS